MSTVPNSSSASVNGSWSDVLFCSFTSPLGHLPHYPEPHRDVKPIQADVSDSGPRSEGIVGARIAWKQLWKPRSATTAALSRSAVS